MTPKERLLAAYRCQTVDRIPLVIWVNPYDPSHWMAREPSYAPLLELAQTTDVLGSWSPGANIHTVLDGLRIDGRDFRKEHIAARDGHYGKTSRYPIESESDLDLLLKYEDYRIPRTVDFARYHEIRTAIGKNGIVLINLPDFIDFLGENISETTFSILSLTALDKLELLISKVHKEYEDFLRYLLENTAENDYTGVHFYGPEFALPPLVRPEVFEKLFRYNQPLIDLIHQYKGLVYMHSHGKVKNFITRFRDAGVDVFDPVEPPPMGDVTITEALNLAGGRMAIQGGFEFGDLELLLKEDQVREKTRSLLQEAEATKLPGFILSLTATPVANILDKKLLNNFQALIGEYRNFYGI